MPGYPVIRRVAVLAGLAAAYFAAAEAGLTLAHVADQVTAVWPPAGLALAALVLGGRRLWPGVAVGALVTAWVNRVSIPAAVAIACGNTAAAVLGAWLLGREPQFEPDLRRLRAVLGLVFLAAGLSTAVAATVGTVSLCAAGMAPWSKFGLVWGNWWLGDGVGVLLAAPVVLTWASSPIVSWPPRRLLEAALLGPALVLVSAAVFLQARVPDGLDHALVFAVIPLLIWTAVRFSPRETATATVVVAVLAVVGTRGGTGPFVVQDGMDPVPLLATWLGLMAITALTLAAAVREHQRADAGRRVSTALLEQIVAATTDAVFVKDRQGRYVMINEAGARFLGKRVDEVIGRDDTEMFSPDTAGAIMAGDRQVMVSGMPLTLEDRGTAAGVTRTYLAMKAPYRDEQGEIAGVIGISRDITERKQAEQALAEFARQQEAVAQFGQRALALTRLPALLEEAVQLVARGLGAPYVAVLQHQPDDLHLAVRAACGWPDGTVGSAQVDRTTGTLVGQMLAREAPLAVADLGREERLQVPELLKSQGIRSCLGVRLQAGRQPYGVLLAASGEAGAFRPQDATFLQVVGQVLSAAIDRIRVERQRKETDSELAAARKIQRRLFPSGPPRLTGPDGQDAGLDIGGASYTAAATGGDYFDYIPLGDGTLVVAVGDISDHGLGPALLMAQTRAHLRGIAQTCTDPARMLTLVNRALSPDLEDDCFCTLLLARLDPRTRSLVYASAGHQGLLLPASRQSPRTLSSTGPPLGVVDDYAYELGEAITLTEGDLLLMMTDGITEALATDEAAFGLERALAIVDVYRAQPAAAIVENLYHAVRAFCQARHQEDDITAVVVKVHGPAPAAESASSGGADL